MSLLLSYPHLQRVNLSSNSITGNQPKRSCFLKTETVFLCCLDVSVLSNLPYLTFLDVSINKLSTVLDFEPPHNLTVQSSCVCVYIISIVTAKSFSCTTALCSAFYNYHTIYTYIHTIPYIHVLTIITIIITCQFIYVILAGGQLCTQWDWGDGGFVSAPLINQAHTRLYPCVMMSSLCVLVDVIMRGGTRWNLKIHVVC